MRAKLCNCTLHRPIGNILFTTFLFVLFVVIYFWWLAWIKLQSKLVTLLRGSTLHWRDDHREGEMGQITLNVASKSGIIACPFDRWGSAPSTACLI